MISASEMAEAVLSRAQRADIFIATAAVADYTPEVVSDDKIKKNASSMQLNLIKTMDIIATVANQKTRPFCVGFAAETDQLETYAKGKLIDKSLDMIAANWVGQKDSGFNSDLNALSVFWQNGEQLLDSKPKPELARELISLIAARYHEKNTT